MATDEPSEDDLAHAKTAIASAFQGQPGAAGAASSNTLVAAVLKQLDPEVWTDEQIDRLQTLLRKSARGLGTVDLLPWVLGAVPDKAAHGPEVVFVLGGPGAGKGTFSSRIATEFGFCHLSAGDLLRAERNREGSQVGELIEEYIRQGQIVPSEVTVGLLEQEMRRQGWEGGRFLVDGFPRNMENYEAWDRQLAQTTRLAFCLVVECSEAVMLERLLERAKTSGRIDDEEGVIRKRFGVFKEDSMPVIQQMEDNGLVRKVNSDPGIDAVWHEVDEIFTNRIA